MTKKYYAVAVGKKPGIYFTWDDCKEQVDQFPGSVYKGFATIGEAESFYQEKTGQTAPDNSKTGKQLSFDDVIERGEPLSTETCLVAYVDGSYEHSKGRYAYGCVMVLPDELVKINGDGADEDYVSMRNVAGEILGSEKAILWAVEHGYSEIIIYYDYEGIEKWANDIWKANKPGTIRYKQFVAEQRKKIKISFCKVTAHTGDTYNEMADKLAKAALGID